MEIQKDDSKIDKTRGNKLITLHLILTQELKDLNHTSAVQCLQCQSLMFLEFFENLCIFMYMYILNDFYLIDLNFHY